MSAADFLMTCGLPREHLINHHLPCANLVFASAVLFAKESNLKIASWNVLPCSLALLAVCVVSQPAAARADLLAVEFNQTSSGPVQGAPFVSLSANPELAASPPAFPAIGSYQVAVTFENLQDSAQTINQQGFYYRSTGTPGNVVNNGAFTFASLYQSFAYTNANQDGPGQILLSIGGVTPNTPYLLTLYSYDPDIATATVKSDTTTFSPTDQTSGGTGTVTFNNGQVPTSNSQFSTTITVTSTTGTLDILASALLTNASGGTSGPIPFADGVRLNGFELNAVPEPASIVMVVLGLGGVAAIGWRRRAAKAA